MIIELIAWRGESDTLAARMNVPHAELMKRLARFSDTQKSPCKIQIALANNSPIFSAVRRKLTGVGEELSDGGAEFPCRMK